MQKTLHLIVAATWCAVAAVHAADMSRYNVVWNSPSKDATGVMPIGNGDIAAGVYAIENGDLYLLLAKNDAFSYCGDLYKTGRVRVSLNPNPFAQASRSGRRLICLPLRSASRPMASSCGSGRTLTGRSITSRSTRRTSLPSLPSRSSGIVTPSGKARTRRPTCVWNAATSCSGISHVGNRSFYPDEMRMTYQLEQPEKILPDPYRFNTFGNLLESPGLTVANGVLAGRGKKFDLRIHSLTMQTPDPGNVWVKAIEDLAARPVNLEADWARHCAWWTSFWDRGWIIASDRTVPAADRERFHGEANAQGLREEPDGAALVAQSYNFFRFAMAAQSRGRIQTKFNGGIFTQQIRTTKAPQYPAGEVLQADGSWITSPDARAWGRRFTFQNQRLLYWPLLMSGDFDLMKPFFDHYWNVLDMRKAITRHYFGHEGAFYRENVMPLTGSCHDCGPLPKTKPGEKYAGDYHAYYFTSGLETVAMMADYVRYTGDTKFRDDVLVPFAREILLFYDKHYLRGPDGKLRLDPAQAIETWWIAVNPAPDVAGLRFCLDQLLAISAGTAEDQATWKKFRAEMPEVPLRTIDGRPALAPAEKYEKQGNGENAELYPVFPFRCYGLALGSKDLVDWTMQHRTCKDTFGGICWTQDQIGWAYAGNAQEAAKGLVRRFRTATNTLRFPIYGNHTTDGIPDLDHFGSGSIALQRMLVQEGHGKIYLLPAWPAEWDVDFKLHLEGGVVLTGTVKDGKLVHGIARRGHERPMWSSAASSESER